MENINRKQTFGKSERLCNFHQITHLFETGKSFYYQPLKVYYQFVTPSQTAPVQILISVPKRIFKHAADRNRIKRLIREAYRKNKYLLSETLQLKNKQCLIALVFTGKTIISYAEMEKAIKQILNRLVSEHETAIE